MMSKLQRSRRGGTPVGAMAGAGVIKNSGVVNAGTIKGAAGTIKGATGVKTVSTGVKTVSEGVRSRRRESDGHIVVSPRVGDPEEIGKRERTQLAYALHDGPARRLVECLHRLDVCERELREPTPQTTAESLLEQLHAATASVRRSLDDMRAIIHQYRSDPKEQSLQALLVGIVKEFEKFSSVDVHLDLPPAAIQLESSQSQVLGAVVEEALFNAWRHGGASSITIHAGASSSCVGVLVEDNGGGFDTGVLKTAGQRGTRMGLLGLRERVEAYGGRFDVRSRPGQGTAVAARLPLELSSGAARRISA